MTVTEPMTMLTDYVIAVESFMIAILLAQVVSGIAVGVQALQLTIAILNANDLYHLVQVVALYLLYRGVSHL